MVHGNSNTILVILQEIFAARQQGSTDRFSVLLSKVDLLMCTLTRMLIMTSLLLNKPEFILLSDSKYGDGTTKLEVESDKSLNIDSPAIRFGAEDGRDDRRIH